MKMKNYPWLQHYPEGVSAEINPDSYPSMLALVEESFQKYATLPAFECMGKSITYAQLDSLTRDFAAYLQSLGLKKGDRIALMMPNVLQYPVALFGAIRAGLIVVNTNPLYTVREMTHQFADSGAVALVVLANFAYGVEQALPKTQIKHVIVTEVGDLLGGFKSLLVNFVVKKVKKMVPAYHLPQAIKMNKVLAIGAGKPYQRPDVVNSDILFLQYTGGTTGVSKGATLTHRNLLANTLQVGEILKHKIHEKEEYVITALPLYHVFALVVNCLMMFRVGAKNVLITNPRDMPGFVKELKKHPFTLITGVNTLFNSLLNQPEFASINFSHLRIASGGGMAVQRAVAERWKKVTGILITEGYGLSETSPVLTCNIPNQERLNSIGVPVPNTEICVMDDDGNILPTGEVGEICAKGPQVMLGYWNRPDETDKVMRGEWFRTGDMGFMEPDGFFHVVDRKKDMVLVSGFNVYPNEVEDEIAKHPGVQEVAVIGVPDEKSGEAVKAFIVKKDPELTAEKIREFCKGSLTSYKIPRHVEFIGELPKTNVGKILRRALKEREMAKNSTEPKQAV
jgi:long-chain acyl-CoA synthetase